MKKIVLIITSLFCTLMAWGAGEITVGIGGGLNSMVNTMMTNPVVAYAIEKGVDASVTSKLPGGMFSTRFLYFFKDGHLGIGSGADFSLYRSKITLNGAVKTSSYDEVNGQAFDLIQTYVGWQEKERIFTFEFPLGAYYKANFSEKTNLVVGFGGKLVVPAFSRYQITDGVYEVSGYYPQTHVTIKDLPHHGFVNTKPVASAGLNTRLAVGVYGELGLNFATSSNLMFHVGLYGNYGLTNIMDGKQMVPDLGTDFMVDNESILSSKVVEKVNIFSVGLKLGITIPTNAEGNTEGTSREEKIAKSIE